jgi:hypothetical protein
MSICGETGDDRGVKERLFMATQQSNPTEQTAETLQAIDVSKRPMMEVLNLLSGDPEMARAYAKEVVGQEVARAVFDQDWRLAKVFALSGVFSDIQGTTEQQAISTAMAKIQLGRSWNINPSDAMQFVYFTNGRPAVMNELFAAKMRDGGFDWDTDFEYEQTTVDNRKRKRCIGCTLWPKRWNSARAAYEPIKDRHGNDVSVSFSKDDADAAMIWEKGKQIPLSEKWNFKAWAEDMYFWRAVSRLRRRFATNILSGVLMREEAEELPPPNQRPQIERPSISLDSFTPSKDLNRGHDEAAGTKSPTKNGESGGGQGSRPGEARARPDQAPGEAVASDPSSAPDFGNIDPPPEVDELPDIADAKEGEMVRYKGFNYRFVEDTSSWRLMDVAAGSAPAAAGKAASKKSGKLSF